MHDLKLLERLVRASGVSGFESEVAAIMAAEFKKTVSYVEVDNFGNVIAQKGKGKKKIMLCAHMDEIGLLVKQITKEGFIKFIKIGGIDDRILVGSRVIIKNAKKDVLGIIGVKPPHLQKDEERKQPIKYEDMFIDIGAKDSKQALTMVSIADPIIFEPSFGCLNDKLYYGKALDDRVGCYVLIKALEKIKVDATLYAVATTQEEVGLKGARTSSFKINPDFALALDTTLAGDTPGIKDTESCLKLGAGVAITLIEASGRGIIVNQKVKDLFINTARKNKLDYQIDVLEGGMTDGAIVYMNREGILTGVLSVPTRYVHSTTSVFHLDDLTSAIILTVKAIEQAVEKL